MSGSYQDQNKKNLFSVILQWFLVVCVVRGWWTANGKAFLLDHHFIQSIRSDILFTNQLSACHYQCDQK